MTDQTTTGYDRRGQHAQSSWAVGGVISASVLMLLVGSFQALAGLVALFQDTFYTTTANYVFEFDSTTWGWIHLLIGLLLGVAGFGVLFGNLAARIVGIGLAVLSAIANFAFMPHYPFWSLAIIALDIFIIWSLASKVDLFED
jgi:hypothetical protein